MARGALDKRLVESVVADGIHAFVLGYVCFEGERGDRLDGFGSALGVVQRLRSLGLLKSRFKLITNVAVHDVRIVALDEGTEWM